MKKDTINSMFENLEGSFDIENPNAGHESRFLNKLKGDDEKAVNLKSSKLNFWKPFMAIAASVVLCISIFTVMQHEPELKDLASVSPEMSKTQDFFTTAISQELAALDNERTPETESIVNDAIKQLNSLEKEYETLKIDLNESGDDKRVIYAMISNFQNRIDLLQNVLKQIEEVKQFNQNKNENKNTI